MLDLTLENVSLARGALAIDGLNAAFARGTHTALIGPSGGGKSTILSLLEGSLRPDAGRVMIGARDATGTRPSARPLFHSARTEEIPGRRSVRHVLVAAARTRRGLDYEDRMDEIARASKAWDLEALLDRRVRDLSSGEALRVRLAQILLLRPAVFLAERPFERATAGTADEIEDRFWRQLRADGCTVVHEIARPEELGWADDALLVDGGRIVASGTPRHVAATAPSVALAALFGPVSAIPVVVSGHDVRSPLGSWTVDHAPFEGIGVALAHPWEFTIAAAGDESDFLFGIEEARFLGWTWELTGLVSGGTLLRVWADADLRPTRGRLLPMRFDPSRFRLFAAAGGPAFDAPADVVPPRGASR